MKNPYLESALFTIMFCFFSLAINAQEKKGEVRSASSTRVNQSNPPASIPSLMKFSGKWIADAVLIADGKRDSIQYHIMARPVADQTGILIDESFNRSNRKMRKTSLAAYDSSDSKIHWYTIDNHRTYEHTGSWLSPDSLLLEHKGSKSGKPYNTKTYFTFKGRGGIGYAFTATLDGREMENVTALFRRDMPVNRPTSNPSDKGKK